MIKYFLILILILQCGVVMADDLQTVKLDIWSNLAKEDYSEMRIQAERCIAMTQDAPEVSGLTNKDAFFNYPKYIMASDFAECLYLKGLSFEKENNCEGIGVYQSVMTRFPTIWTGWPGTSWQPADLAKEGLKRLTVICKN